MMHEPRTLRGVFSWCAAVLLVLTTFGTGRAATQSARVPTQWSAVPIYEGEDLKDNDPIDLAASDDGEIAVTWAHDETKRGISVRHRQESSWSWLTDSYESPAGFYARAPTSAYSGTQRLDVWIQSADTQLGCNDSIQVRQADSAGRRSSIGADYYNPCIEPALAAGTSGWHVVFAAASSAADCTGSKVDLYYAYLPSLGDDDWLTPTVVITHGAVISSATRGGGVTYPRIATSPDGNTLHVVWQQREQLEDKTVRTSAWYISGTLSPVGDVTWSPPVRISPETYPLVVLPDVAATSDGRVHLVWTRVDGKRASPTGQYVYYYRLPDGALHRLTEQRIAVNMVSPRYFVRPSVTTHGDTVCVAWQGYWDGLEKGPEDIHLICSEDGGNNWGAILNISNSADYLSAFPRIAFSPTGSLHAVWVEYALKDEQWEPYSVFYGPAFRIFMPLVLRSG